jgi:immunoglobulin-like protein involved in spore germination
MKRIVLIVVVVGIAAGVYWYLQRSDGVGPMPGPSASATPLADDMIVLYEPLPESYISSPLKVRGKARGTWFFEASFPVTLTDWDGRIIAQVPAQAKGDWMTTEFVEFEATLTFQTPAGPGGDLNRGFLILQKDNPSGLPQYDDSREITVYFR